MTSTANQLENMNKEIAKMRADIRRLDATVAQLAKTTLQVPGGQEPVSVPLTETISGADAEKLVTKPIEEAVAQGVLDPLPAQEEPAVKGKKKSTKTEDKG